MSRRIFVVTGANRGIGFETVRELGKRLKLREATIVLCSRTKEAGENAVSSLAMDGVKANLELLDVADEGSRNRFASTLRGKYGRVDCLINNAGIAFPPGSKQPITEQAKETCAVNYLSTRDITMAIAPLFRHGSKVVFLSSKLESAGPPFMSSKNRDRLLSPCTTVKDIDAAVRDYLNAAPNWKEHGWPRLPYLFSKAAVIALTAALARQADKCKLTPNVTGIIVTACYPGWCKTDLAGWKAPPLSSAEGGKVVAQVALCAGTKEHGNLVVEGREIKVPSQL
ncbi:hypothetical protein ETH_00019485 [Eimeria tenella]|uniref:Carbonyl reductase n=1 Tax=Eimeria tenella TaxID=5802 RepID=U6KR84_EIMTE|nr:hypothetical protein ETH_00019485 [Eimeria tenella]CDJ40461.1 hypothetical protein ETH_00019485 [Eimeria tenella]|eukprot:XP_013231211.1 hypothetical protein ETH_00019485 [Eimeria tenella]